MYKMLIDTAQMEEIEKEIDQKFKKLAHKLLDARSKARDNCKKRP